MPEGLRSRPAPHSRRVMSHTAPTLASPDLGLKAFRSMFVVHIGGPKERHAVIPCHTPDARHLADLPIQHQQLGEMDDWGSHRTANPPYLCLDADRPVGTVITTLWSGFQYLHACMPPPSLSGHQEVGCRRGSIGLAKAGRALPGWYQEKLGLRMTPNSQPLNAFPLVKISQYILPLSASRCHKVQFHTHSATPVIKYIYRWLAFILVFSQTQISTPLNHSAFGSLPRSSSYLGSVSLVGTKD